MEENTRFNQFKENYMSKKSLDEQMNEWIKGHPDIIIKTIDYRSFLSYDYKNDHSSETFSALVKYELQ